MDIVYPVKFGNYNPELKISLRSLDNLKFDTGMIVVAGFIPEWYRGYGLEVRQHFGDNFKNTSKILRAVCEDPHISDNFILMSDDIFINQPLKAIPTLHRGTLKSYVEMGGTSNNAYARDRELAYNILCDMGITEPLNYDLHTPMIINKKDMLVVLDKLGEHGHSHKRSIYGNLMNIGGKESIDVKVYGNIDWSEYMPIISTSDDAFRIMSVGKYLRKKFNKKSIYEL